MRFVFLSLIPLSPLLAIMLAGDSPSLPVVDQEPDVCEVDKVVPIVYERPPFRRGILVIGRRTKDLSSPLTKRPSASKRSGGWTGPSASKRTDGRTTCAARVASELCQAKAIRGVLKFTSTATTTSLADTRVHLSTKVN